MHTICLLNLMKTINGNTYEETRHDVFLKGSDWNMSELNFICEIRNYRQIQLGKREEQFLGLIFQQDLGAYDILKILRDDIKEPMGYKDVFQRLKRLESLGLVEQTGQKGKRNKILYRLTNRGLFQVFLSGNEFPSPSVLNKKEYRHNVILKTLIYQFFEPGTISKFITYPRVFILKNYLRKCCQSLLKIVDPTITARRETEDEIAQINELIRDEAKDLLFQIVSSKIRDTHSPRIPYKDPVLQKQRYGTDESEDENGPNYVDLFPKPALKKDKKFMKLLMETKDDFDNGHKYYLEP